MRCDTHVLATEAATRGATTQTAMNKAAPNSPRQRNQRILRGRDFALGLSHGACRLPAASKLTYRLQLGHLRPCIWRSLVVSICNPVLLCLKIPPQRTVPCLTSWSVMHSRLLNEMALPNVWASCEACARRSGMRYAIVVASFVHHSASVACHIT